MKFTYQYVVNNRYDQNANKVRKLGDRFVIMTVISKALSPLPVYLFLNLGLHPDTVTIISLLFIVLSGISFLLGSVLWAVIFMLCFGLLDSVDGDMARCVGPTKYGGVFDSFGADLFYSVMPLGVGYYLFSQNTSVWGLNSGNILLISAGVSLSFILYRLINTKVLNFRRGLKESDNNHSQVAKASIKSGWFVNLLELYRHVLLRGNFFAEPGMIFWFTILFIFHANGILVWYLVAILLYNMGYLVTNFIGTYVYFKSLK